MPTAMTTCSISRTVSRPRSEVGLRKAACSTRSPSRSYLLSKAEIKDRARALGFDLVGVGPLGPFPESVFDPKWLESGYAGRMHYLERQKDAKISPESVLRGAKSVIVCAMNYNTDYPLTRFDRLRAWVSRYAWGEDYHNTLRTKLE